MRRKDSKPKPSTESAYQKRQRRRAERIIRAISVFPGELRAKVQHALDNDRKLLPRLLAEADIYWRGAEEIRRDMDERISRILSESTLLPRAPKVDCLPEILADPNEYAAQRSFEMVRLLSDPNFENDLRWEALTAALIELSNQTCVYYYHPLVVEAFFTQAVLTAIQQGKDGKPDRMTQRVLNEIQAAMDKSTPRQVLQDIIGRYNGESTGRPSADYLSTIEPQGAPSTPAPEPRESHELSRLRDRLENLELVPENEATRFQLETQIYKLQREAESVDEWPNVIGEHGGGDAAR